MRGRDERPDRFTQITHGLLRMLVFAPSMLTDEVDEASPIARCQTACRVARSRRML